MNMLKYIFTLLILANSYLQAYTQVEVVPTIDTLIQQNTVLPDTAAEPFDDNGDNENYRTTDTTIGFGSVMFNADSISHLKKNKAYTWSYSIDSLLKAAQYKADQEKENRAKNKTRKTEAGDDKEVQQNSNANNGILNAPFLKILLWVLAAAMLAFIVYQLFLSNGFFSKGAKKISTTEIPEQFEEENMDNDFALLYKQAYAKADYRLAMRYIFLQTIQNLNTKSKIIYAPEKTNAQYVQELPVSIKNDFAQLALYYEYIWYGKVSVSQPTFDGIANKVNNFLNKI